MNTYYVAESNTFRKSKYIVLMLSYTVIRMFKFLTELRYINFKFTFTNKFSGHEVFTWRMALLYIIRLTDIIQVYMYICIIQD